MSVTILGQHISLIRPSRPKVPNIYRNERPKTKYDMRTKTIKEHSGKVVAICVKARGKVFSLAKGIHATVCISFNIDPEEVEASGWELENGNFVWR